MESAATSGSPDAVHVKAPAVEVGLKQGTIDTVERMWNAGLQWGHDNPLQFVAVLGFLAWWLYQRRLGRRETAAMKLEYERERNKYREPQLPLPAPAERQESNG